MAKKGYCMLEEADLSGFEISVFMNHKKIGTFPPFRDCFLPTVWQYIWKRKANAYHTPSGKSTDTIFDNPGMHYTLDL